MNIYLIQTSHGIVALNESFIAYIFEWWLANGGLKNG